MIGGIFHMKVVIIDDEGFWIERITKIAKNVIEDQENIDNIKLKKNDRSIISFTKYNNDLKKTIYSGQKNIYVIDIKLQQSKMSGYDIARIIREEAKDWESVIIFSSAFDMKEHIISDRLSALTYISKFKDFDLNMHKSLELALSIIIKKRFISITSHRVSYKLLIDNIFYVEKIKNSKYCIIKTSNNEFRVRSSLSGLNKNLKFRIHKNYLLLNNNNVIQTNETEVIFKDQSRIPIN